MQFLKTMFWVTLAVIAVIFSYNNWTDTEVALWGNKVWATKLPVPLFFAFLIGVVPTLLLHRTTRWSLKRKIDTMERSLADIRIATGQTTSTATPVSAAPLSATSGAA